MVKDSDVLAVGRMPDVEGDDDAAVLEEGWDSIA